MARNFRPSILMLNFQETKARANHLGSNSSFCIAVGASGKDGLRDIKKLSDAFPSGLAAVLLIVLHRPSDKPSHLREFLSRGCPMPVRIPDEGEHFQVGTCYIGEPAAHLTLAARSDVKLVPGAHNLYRNRTVDLLFTSVACHAKTRGLGVVLSGDLDDGARGLAAIHNEGGATMVLARHSDIPGMPENAATYDGPIDFIGSVEEIALEVKTRVGRHRVGNTYEAHQRGSQFPIELAPEAPTLE